MLLDAAYLSDPTRYVLRMCVSSSTMLCMLPVVPPICYAAVAPPPLPILIFLSFGCCSSASYAQYIAAVVPALNIARLLLVGYGWREDRRAVAAMSRTGDAKELLRGPLYYTLVLFAVVCIYWRTSPVGAAPHVIPVSFLICSACVGAARFSPAVPRSLSDPFCSTSELLL